ncbi:phospholipase A1-like [Brevipalpus obovatus]|uniref:phospholipase A1-like n=1 Tax=Brevipalpus obovatus TaxID=246614 RepID=UPI003D9DE5E7
MLIFISLTLLYAVRGENFDYPVEGPELVAPLNPQLFSPCLAPVFDFEYGRFDPVLFVNFPLTLPPISGCPELFKKKTIRFLAISRENPNTITTVQDIKPGSKIAIYIHGYTEEYDSIEGITAALTTLRDNDWVVLVDWARLAHPRTIGRLRIPYMNVVLAGVNTLLLGRVTCKFIKFMNEKHGILIEDIFLVGFSYGAVTLGFLADYCREKYRIHFNHMMGIELVAKPFRNSNYPLTNHTSAKFFNALLSTRALGIPVVDDISSNLAHLGYYEVAADCAYYVNHELILAEQPPCFILPGPTFCSHFFGLQVFIAAYSGRCLYQYGPCPVIVRVPSNQEVGFTKLDCSDHPFLQRTCIRTSSNPLKSC